MKEFIIVCFLLISCPMPERQDTGMPMKPGLPPVVVACAGDSIMRPIPGHLRELRKTGSFKFVLKEWAQGGLNSETYQGFFGRRRGTWESARPDMILLQLGTNDAWLILRKKRVLEDFERGIRAILSEFLEFRSASGLPPRLLIATIPRFMFIPEEAELNAIIENLINPALARIAVEVGADIVDNHQALEDRPDLYDPDGIHPNAAGERILAGNWFRAMKKAAFRDSRT